MSDRKKTEAYQKPTSILSQAATAQEEQLKSQETKRQLIGHDWSQLSWEEAEKEQDRIFKQCSERVLPTFDREKNIDQKTIDEMNRSMPSLPNSLASPLPDTCESSTTSNNRSSLVGGRRRSSLLSRSSLKEITCLNDFSFGVLPGYQAQLEDEAILHSEEKLDKAADELRPFVDGKKCPIISLPCQTEEETLGYRCKCSFQIIYDGTKFQYAMRSKGEPVLLESSVFLVANQRIQMAMEGLLDQVLNANYSADDSEDKDPSPYPNIVNEHLASVTFASSWNDDRDEGDCIVTMNYSAAVETADTNWLEEAKHIVRTLKLTQLHVRSKKVVLSAVMGGLEKCWGCFLRDTIYLVPPLEDGETWDVSCHPPQQHAIAVHYHKPEGAFFHPNAGVMCQALSWMLDRISKVAESLPSSPRLLEMYCGCGAHTLALARSGILASIQAVEYDHRLVDACSTNIEINLARAQPQDIEMSPIQVMKGDAGRWAQKHQKRTEAASQDDSAEEDDFDILLVDPPRQGLDSQVIDLAIQTKSIQHVLIISCGLQALVRDLKLLCSDFEIINCEQLDLFPRTDSVETLVHLRRKTK